MSNKRSFPGPIVILMVVIVLAAIATWLLPAGQYYKLSAGERSFVFTTPSGDIGPPLAQKLKPFIKDRTLLDILDAGIPSFKENRTAEGSRLVCKKLWNF